MNPNQVDLPRWRIDNIYVFIFSLISSVIISTISVTTIYWNIVIDVRDIKKDTTAMLKWEDKHDTHTTVQETFDNARIKNLNDRLLVLETINGVKISDLSAILKQEVK